MPGQPRSVLLDIHVAKSIKDLNTKVQINDSTISKYKPQTLLRSSQKVLETADIALKNGDEEMAYIHFMKYLHVAQALQRHKEKTNFDKSNLKRCLESAESLQKSLEKRYELLRMANEVENCIQTPDIPTPPRSLSPMEVNGVEEPTVYENSVTCRELYNLIAKHRGTRGLLLIDIRTENDFLDSHIDVPCVINIPENILEAGKSTSWIDKSLPPKYLQLWKSRGESEYIVILDWSSKIEDTIPGSKLFILRNIFERWDINIVYKHKPLILEGGFEEWLMYYPAETTNPSVKPPNTSDNSLDDFLLEDLEYPTLGDSLSPIVAKVVPNLPNIDRGLKPMTVPVIKPSVQSTIVEKKLEPLEPVRKDAQPSHIPLIDRTSKQFAIERMKQEKDNVAKAVKELQEQKAVKEKEMELLRITREAEADREMFTFKEEALRADIERLEKECKHQETEKIRIQKELDNVQKNDENLTRPKSSPSVPSNQSVPLPKGPKPTTVPSSTRPPSSLTGGKTTPQSSKSVNASTIDQEQIKFAALKLDGPSSSGGLTRSHSSPNINNLDDNMPGFDRTTKPVARNLLHLEAHRQRDFSPVYGDKGPGLTGLKNLGNSCYMNSIVQCISNTVSLNIYLRSASYRNNTDFGNRARGQIVEELAAVLRALWSGQYRSIACKDFKRVAGSYHSDFAGFRQQDSHEFLTLLVDWLHDDLNKRRNMKPPPSPATNEDQNTDLVKSSDSSWHDFIMCNDSHILRLFYGQQSSTVKCKSCNFNSVTFEPFSSLTLVLPQGDKVNVCSLTVCLNMYLAPEQVSEWKCPKCKVPRPATKKFDIWKLPPILVIHFKRFYEDVLWKKQHTMVDFPLKMLDMVEFTAFPHQKHTRYDLYAVSNHYGTMDGGHYTTYSRSHTNNKWYKFDDADVSEISESNVRSNAAYILFYSSLNLEVPRSVNSAS